MDADKPRSKKGSPCPKCGNLLRLRADQLGEQVKCPKCDAAFTVGVPEEARPSAAAEDSYEPVTPLRKSAIVPDEPVEIVHEEAPQMHVPEGDEAELADLATSAPLSQDIVYDVDWSSAEGEMEAERPIERPRMMEPEYLELAHAQGYVRVEEQGYMPRWTFFSAVFEFPWLGQNAWRWAMIAFGLAAIGVVSVPIIALMKRGPDLMMIPLSILAAGLLLFTGAAVSACFLSAIQDTADGYREVQESSLAEIGQWFFMLLGLLYVWGLSGVIGYPLVLIEAIGPVAVPISMILIFPILVLCAMDGDSFLLPYSPRILRTLARLWWIWLGFYLISTALLAAWVFATQKGFEREPYLTGLAAGVALAAIILIYARLLGRVAWKAGIVLEGAGETAAVAVGGKSRRRRRRGRRRIDFPPELDQAARFVDPPPARPPKR